MASRAGRLAGSVLLVLALGACSGGEKPAAMLASAKAYLAKNEPKSAIIQAKNALQDEPNSAEGRYLLGLALLRTGDAAGAESELRKALSFGYPAEEVTLPLAQALMAQREHRKLIAEFASADLASSENHAAVKTLLAGAYAATGKPELAREALKAALAADPDNAPALLVQAREKADAKDFDGALAVADTILAKHPVNAEVWKLKGDVFRYGKRQMDEALAAYRKAIELKPDFALARAALVQLLLTQGKVEDASAQLELLKKTAPETAETKYLETLLAYRNKDLKLARELSQQTVKLAPNSPQALQLAGAIELQAGSVELAETYLVKALQLSPQSTLPRRMLVTAHMRNNQAAKALAALQPLLQGANLDAATNALAGQVYLQLGDAKKAQPFLALAAKQDPKNSKTRTSLALTHMAEGKDEVGLAELQEIASAESDVTADLAIIGAHLRRKEFDLADKKPEDARKRFEAVLAKDPKNGHALLALAELRARTGGAAPEVTELIRKAVDANPEEKSLRLLLVDYLLRNNDPKQALAAAQSALTVLPASAELMDAQGRAQQASGDLNQALISFGKVVSMQPQSTLPLLRLASAQRAAKDKDAAASSLRKALAIKPDLLDAQRGLMTLHLENGKLPEALAISATIQKQRPKDAAGYVLEGDAAASQKKLDQAVDAYQRGLKVARSPELAVKLHSTLARLNKTAERDKFAAAWLKDNPKDAGFRLYLGDAAVYAQDYRTAEKWYLNVTEVQPSNAMALNNLAWVTGKLNKEGAVAYAEKAVALAPDQAAFADTLAMLLSDKSDYPRALAWGNKALALQPRNPAFRLSLAKIHIKGGQKDLARKELDELAKLGDKFPGQAEVGSLLKTL